jgi:hypothetical protein
MTAYSPALNVSSWTGIVQDRYSKPSVYIPKKLNSVSVPKSGVTKPASPGFSQLEEGMSALDVTVASQPIALYRP